MTEVFHDRAAAARQPGAEATGTGRWQVLTARVSRWLAVLRPDRQPTLGDVDEHMLRDIGLTRMDTTWHIRTPPLATGVAHGPDGQPRAAPRAGASVDVTV